MLTGGLGRLAGWPAGRLGRASTSYLIVDLGIRSGEHRAGATGRDQAKRRDHRKGADWSM